MDNLTLMNYLSSYDRITADHVCRVARYSYLIGETLELSKKELSLLFKASLLHDIGKIYIPTKLLEKKEKLTSEEFQSLREHVDLGLSILPESLGEVKKIISAHHERLDGSGYPNHLRGEEIPKLAGILAIADSYDAMTSNRVYNKVKTPAEAFDDLLSNTAYNGEDKYSYVYVKKFMDRMEHIVK